MFDGTFLIDSGEQARIRERLARVITMLPSEEAERTGGYYTRIKVLCADEHEIHFHRFTFQVGTVPKAKANKYLVLSVEKVQRTAMHTDHVSSFQSQEPENGMWPGAIRLNEPDMLDGFSGLPWKHDETLVLWSNVEEGHLSVQGAHERAKISGNDVFFALAREVPCLQVEEDQGDAVDN